MDIIDVMRPFFDFLVRFFSVEVVLGGYAFTVGAFFMWCFLVVLIIGFLKGLGD